MAPFLAFQEYGDSFKWVFYGDDDTVFFPDAALAVAEKLDHNLPIFLSGNSRPAVSKFVRQFYQAKSSIVADHVSPLVSSSPHAKRIGQPCV